jgi:FkbM family methyltransferase
MSAVLKLLRSLREGRRIRGLRGTIPDGPTLFECWRSLKLLPRQGPVSVRLGSLTLYGHNRGELSFLFDEIFVKQEYAVPIARNDPVILDCGANIGFATLYFKLRWPAARVISFEPNPSCFQLLQRNVEENGLGGVTLVQAACGKSTGAISFFVNPSFSLRSSIDARRANGDQEIQSKLVRLSEHITGEVDLLKVDVEGSEWEIMEDLVTSGKLACIQRMVIEYHHRIGTTRAELSRFLRTLEDAGFTYDLVSHIPSAIRFTGCFQDVMLYASRHCDQRTL